MMTRFEKAKLPVRHGFMFAKATETAGFEQKEYHYK
jgi:hypothetical protein